MKARVFSCLMLLAFVAASAEKYTGPTPPKPDIPYLLHASNLTGTEVSEAHEEKGKGETVYTISGANSPARTPLAEPVLIMQADRLAPDRMELYKVEVRNGNRVVSLSQRGRNGSHPVHMTVTPLGSRLYRLEADEPLENGEYCLSPGGSNQVFCFQVF